MRNILFGLITGLLIGSVLFNLYLMKAAPEQGYSKAKREQMDLLVEAMGK